MTRPRARRFRWGWALGLGVIGLASLGPARAQDQPLLNDSDLSPYHRALLAYKAGKYQDAYDYLEHSSDSVAPQDAEKTAILESMALTELKRYNEAEKILRPQLTSNGPVEIQLALGDVLLHKGSFDRATKYYGLAQQAKPTDPDITLKLVYARLGAADLVGAGKYASKLQPMNPKNPYDTHASYYFAKAALAQAAGDIDGAEKEIQDARTIYGITVANRYLKTYLEFFAATAKGPASDLTPPPPAKDGKQP